MTSGGFQLKKIKIEKVNFPNDETVAVITEKEDLVSTLNTTSNFPLKNTDVVSRLFIYVGSVCRIKMTLHTYLTILVTKLIALNKRSALINTISVAAEISAELGSEWQSGSPFQHTWGNLKTFTWGTNDFN